MSWPERRNSGRLRGTPCGPDRHSTLVSADAAAVIEARTIITELVRAHEQGLRLAKQLMVAQECADAAQTNANYAVAIAASDPNNRDAIQRAIRESEKSEAADKDEMTALARWGDHVLSLSRLIATIDDLRWLDGPPITPDPSSPMKLSKPPLSRSAWRNPPHGLHGTGPIDRSSD